MAVLGKRKAPEKPSISQEEAEAIFRKHFEQQFAPLDPKPASKKQAIAGTSSDDSDEDKRDNGSEDSEDGEEWGGLSEEGSSEGNQAEYDEEDSDDDSDPAVEVIDHSVSQTPKAAAMSKQDLKAFMSSRPPDQTRKTTNPEQQQPSSKTKSKDTLPEDAPSLLANDLELRRLLSESHLLTSKTPSLSAASAAQGSKGSTPLESRAFNSGRIRRKTTDMRIQALGSKDSILKQEKMPMNMRKGINAAAEAREAKRRREAKENGIILERPAALSKGKSNGGSSRRRGDMGIDRPGMGRLKGAELRLSDRDVKSIEGSRDAFGRKGGGGGKGRRR